MHTRPAPPGIEPFPSGFLLGFRHATGPDRFDQGKLVLKKFHRRDAESAEAAGPQAEEVGRPRAESARRAACQHKPYAFIALLAFLPPGFSGGRKAKTLRALRLCGEIGTGTNATILQHYSV